MDKFIQECLSVLSGAARNIQSAVIGLSGYFSGMDYAERARGEPPPRILIENKTEQVSEFLEFTEKEILKMPKEFRKLFKTKGGAAHIRKKKNGVYEIRRMIDGVNYYAASKNLALAKKKFIDILNQIPTAAAVTIQRPSVKLFKDWIDDWLEIVKKPKIKEVTFLNYRNYIDKHIIPKFGDADVKSVMSIDIQKFINSYGESRTAQRIYEVMTSFYTYAENAGIIDRSPMRVIEKPLHYVEEKKPLTLAEEKAFVETLFSNSNPYRYVFVVMLYAGLRRSEVKTSVIDENWITVKCAKQRRGQPVKFRKIPVSPMLRKFFPIGTFPNVGDDVLTRVFKKICPNHNLHELRHTFNTRARECGVPKELVQKWCGHKPPSRDVNESVYMHYSDEYQLREIKKVEYTYE